MAADDPLDCDDGLACANAECERRHLDPIEGMRSRAAPPDQARMRFPARPSLVCTASVDMGRTASTWVFNAVRLLYRRAQEACDSYWIRALSAEKLRLRSASAAHVLVKTHEYTPHLSAAQFAEVRPLFTHVIVSVRQSFAEDPGWMAAATHVIHFEDIVAGEGAGAVRVLRALAEHLGLGTRLSDGDLQAVDYELMTLPIPGDQTTKFWSFHSRRGGRAPPPPPALPVESAAAPFDRHVLVTRHGARIDNGPDANPHWLKEAGHGRRHDPHLSPSGRAAADELAAAIAASGVRLSRIVSSPHIRCVETADAVATRLSVPIAIEPGIAEVGSRDHALLSVAELAARFPRIDSGYAPVMRQADLGVERSDGQAAARACDTAQSVLTRLTGNLLFVGHGASCLGLVEAFGASGYVGYASLSHFVRRAEDEGTGWWVLQGRLGEVSHLSDRATARNSAW